MDVFHQEPTPIAFVPCQGVQQLANGTFNVISIFDRLIVSHLGPQEEPVMVGVTIMSLWTGGQGRFEQVLRIYDDDGNLVQEARTEFELPQTSARHYHNVVLGMPARPGVYALTLGRADFPEMLRQDFTVEVQSPPTENL